jgi:hypothetical protein
VEVVGRWRRMEKRRYVSTRIPEENKMYLGWMSREGRGGQRRMLMGAGGEGKQTSRTEPIITAKLL